MPPRISRRFVPLVLALAIAAFSPIAHTQSDTAPSDDLYVQSHPGYFSSYSNPLRPSQPLLLRFTAAVDPAGIAENAVFVDEDGQRVAALATRATPAQEEALQSYDDEGQPIFAGDRFVLVRPAQPLPFGENWKFELAAGLVSRDGLHRSPQAAVLRLGDLRPFTVRGASARNPYNAGRHIDIQLGKQLADSMTAQEIADRVGVSPRPEGLKVEHHSSRLTIRGDFDLDRDYHVFVRAGLVGRDETRLTQPFHTTLRFAANEPFVSLPAYSVAQLSSGVRDLEINAGNLDALTIRVKQLDERELIYALRGYEVYQRDRGGDRQRAIAFEMVPGRSIWESTTDCSQVFDRIDVHRLDWREVLGLADDAPQDDTDATPAALYLCAEGDGIGRSRGTTCGAQAIIQLTDIGLAWKSERDHLLVYCFSLAEGHPLAGVSLDLVDDNADTVRRATSDAHGLVRLPRPEEVADARWLRARLGDDRHVMAVDRFDDTLSPWRFSVRYRHRYDGESDDGFERRTFLFTDRPVYRPGDDVHLKAITRLTDLEALLPPSIDAGASAQLKVRDSRHRTILDTRLTVSEFGSLDHRFTLPAKGVGGHSLSLDFNPVADPDAPPVEPRHDLIVHHYFEVAEYRPNTFELTIGEPVEAAVKASDTRRIELPVSASYLRGKALSRARLQWSATRSPWRPRGEGLENYVFARPASSASTAPGSHLSDELALADDGTAVIALDLPADEDASASLPQQVRVSAEITDINQQTVAQTHRFTVHSADHYLGIRQPESTAREGEVARFGLAAIDQAGLPLTAGTIPAEVVVEKRVRHTVKVRSAGDATRTRSIERSVEVRRESVAIATSLVEPDGLISAGVLGTPWDFTPAEPGDYRLTVTSHDAAGRDSVSSIDFRVIGRDDRAYEYRDGIRITVTPEKPAYQPGETARLFVDSPVLGHALVTVERHRIRESFIHRIDQHRDVIEIPVPADAAPNVFVSVLIVRGAEHSPHQHPSTDYRIGYAEILVDDPGRALSVEIRPSQEKYQPGAAIEVVATVRNAAGDAIANTEVTLFAVDEGVLSLTGFQTPDPTAVLHAPYPLDVRTGQSISELLDEDPDERYFGNKGYVIGGGGPMGAAAMPETRMRRDFKAVAFWQGSLITDPQGRVQVSFTAPDKLTEYRMIAIAANGDRFASADTAITIDQPLILEPALPAFSNVGDDLDLSAVLHNNTDRPLTLDVSLELDSRAVFRGEVAPVIPASLEPAAAAGATETRVRRVQLSPGESAALAFPVRFVDSGTARWTWSAVSTSAPQLGDRVESTLEVGYPLPLLREVHEVRLDPADGEPHPSVADALSKISPELLRGRGQVRVTASNSRVVEALDALDYLLKYPYGCVEQTTSSTLPWLSTQNLRGALPALDKSDAEIAAAVRAGTGRLLSMQTADGGLGYWPGANESVLWGSTYGGMALALAGRQGVDLPGESLDALWRYLSESLRHTDKLKAPYDLSQRCLALYTLALAGAAEPAYHDVLFQRRSELPPEARALLALAMLESHETPTDSDRQRARELLAEREREPESEVEWYGAPYTLATRLLAWSRLDPGARETEALIDELASLRQGERAWGSTYRNAWPFLAITTQSRASIDRLSDARLTIALGDQSRQFDFGREPSSAESVFDFDGDLGDTRLRLATESPLTAPLYAQVEIETRPDQISAQAVDRGFAISRRYHVIEPDGATRVTDDFEIGDLVLITLDLDIPEKQHYLAIDDPLPAIFEAINPEFSSRGGRAAPLIGDERGQPDRRRLYTHHRELRRDRALFFCDYLHQAGRYRLQYLARVVAAGEATAPAAKIEAMYQPQRHGLSATHRVRGRAIVGDDGSRKPSEVALR